MTMLEIELDRSGEPLYLQLAAALAEKVQQQQLLPGARLPTHRALAEQLGVTIGTVTRGYAEAERRGVIEARVGAGTYIRRADAHNWTSGTGTDKSAAPAPASFGYNIPPTVARAQWVQSAMAAMGHNLATLDQLLLYSSPEGISGHRELVAQWLRKQAINADPDQLLFTSGAQHGVQLALQALTRAGDTILVERLTYPGLISLARSQQLLLKPVAMDQQGLEPAALEAACRQHQPRLLYTMPTLQNPTTAIMDRNRRAEIVEICRRHQVLIIEDDVHGLLPEPRPEPLLNIAPDQVLHIGGLGKALAPGLRVGYLQAPRDHRQALVAAIQNHSWMISPLLTGIAAILVENGAADVLLSDIRQQMTRRWERVSQTLGAYQLRYHPQGFHGWLQLPEHWSLSEFLMACRQQGVDVKSSELFVAPGQPAPAWVRIAASSPTDMQQLEQGVELLLAVLQREPRAGLTL